MSLTYVDNSNRSPLIPSIITDDIEEVMRVIKDKHLKTEEIQEAYFDMGSKFYWDGEVRPKIPTSKAIIQLPCSQLELFKEALSYRTPTGHSLLRSGSPGKEISWLFTYDYAQEIIEKLNKTIPNYVDVIIRRRQLMFEAKRLSPLAADLEPTPLPNVN